MSCKNITTKMAFLESPLITLIRKIKKSNQIDISIMFCELRFGKFLIIKKNKCDIFLKKNISWPLFMDTIQLPQGWRATTRRQVTFNHKSREGSSNWVDQLQKDEKLSWHWSHSEVLRPEQMNWKSSILTTRPLICKTQLAKD